MWRATFRPLLVAFVVAAIAATGSQAAISLRFVPKPGRSMAGSLALFQQDARALGLGATICRPLDGNPRTGWLHIRCAGSFAYMGKVSPFAFVATPFTCAQIRYVLTSPRLRREVDYAPFPHRLFDCRWA